MNDFDTCATCGEALFRKAGRLSHYGKCGEAARKVAARKAAARKAVRSPLAKGDDGSANAYPVRCGR